MREISFGSIYKVNTSACVAEKAINTVKYRINNFKNSKLLGNPEKAHLVSPNEQDVYIFTGKDGENYWKSYCEAFDRMEWAHNYYKGDEFFDIEADSAWQEHADWTDEYLQNHRSKIKNLNIVYDINEFGGETIKSINIIA